MTSLQRILYVDDEPDIQEVAKMTLEAIGGFTVETCNSGQEAIEKAAGFAPDLILLDVMMPGMDGPSTLQELRKLPKITETPVIFMTAKVQAQEIEEYKKMGAADVITKPFDPMTLSEQVKKIWDKS
ncbi:MAG: hypothetical protein CMM60_10945 [Rhodospirillaceae bacterium]|jgi:CheY-like chemotaxis protein|nr:hypothetical protein [Rhodospirillaceae bacterium]|tara:strand:+ start:369 stop:749 length:381 start_codon:yes stop_codon:yes gene_type:complete